MRIFHPQNPVRERIPGCCPEHPIEVLMRKIQQGQSSGGEKILKSLPCAWSFTSFGYLNWNCCGRGSLLLLLSQLCTILAPRIWNLGSDSPESSFVKRFFFWMFQLCWFLILPGFPWGEAGEPEEGFEEKLFPLYPKQGKAAVGKNQNFQPLSCSSWEIPRTNPGDFSPQHCRAPSCLWASLVALPAPCSQNLSVGMSLAQLQSGARLWIYFLYLELVLFLGRERQ